MLPACSLVSPPLNCRNWTPNDAPRQPTSFSAWTLRPRTRAWLLVQPPGWAPPATRTLVSASHMPPSFTPHSSFSPSVRPSQPVPVIPTSVAAGLPLTETTFSGGLGLAAVSGVCWASAPLATARNAIKQAAPNRASRQPPPPPKRWRPDSLSQTSPQLPCLAPQPARPPANSPAGCSMFVREAFFGASRKDQ